MKGLSYKKVDLHLHTPASKCFLDRNVTPKKYIKQCITLGLDVISITDHNTAEWVDLILKEAEGTKLVVFPGVEITASSGVHILAIFDVKKRSKDIEYLLNQLKIHPDEYGKSTAISKLSELEIIEEIETEGAIAILPHINDVKGAFKELQGTTRKNLFNSSTYMAVECDTSELPTEFSKKYGFTRVPPIIQSSDNPDPKDKRKHSIDGIGTKYTLLKLDEDVNLEGLRQCFYDPKVRIRNKNNYKTSFYPKILNLKASEGFMKHQNINFHNGLNSIIGGKGVGKSLIVEFLRFILDQESNDIEIRSDHSSKLEKQLGFDNYIEATIQLESNVIYKLKRYFSDDSRIECINEKTGEKYQGDINKLFNILSYSQTEVVKISEKPKSQIELIDSFIDNEKEIQKIKALIKKLNENDKKYSRVLKAEADYIDYQTDIATLREKIKNLSSQLSSNKKEQKIFKEYEKYETKKYAFENQIDFLDDLKEKIDNWKEDVEEIELEELHKDVALDKQLSSNNKKINELISNIELSISEMYLSSDKIKDLVSKKYKSWMVVFQKKEKEYKLSVNNEEEKKKINLERKRLTDNKNNINKKYVKCREEKNKKSAVLSDRKKLIKELIDAHNEIFKNRKEKYSELTKISNKRIRLMVIHNEDRSKYLNKLVELLKGTNVRKTQIESVVNNLLPNEFIPIVLNKNTLRLVEKTNILEENAEKIIMKLLTSYSFDEILRLEYNYTPEDVPIIEYKIGNNNYSPLNKISIGQKCTALLIIALSDGTCPVIIDQPEDALDITTVWEDISKNLRNNKEKRQFIVTTHNPSVAVSSDTDMYIVIKSNSRQANVKCLGAIDCSDVKKEVIKHLEGGIEPYELRRQKYSVDRM